MPGIYRRHKKGCGRQGRCECSYVLIWRHRGQIQKESYRTFTEAREAKSKRDGGDTRPNTKTRFGVYFHGWIETYAGRTSRGFTDSTREGYRKVIEDFAIPKWRDWRLGEIEPADVLRIFNAMRAEGISTARILKLRAALSVLFATAHEEGLIPGNPAKGVHIPPAPGGEDSYKRPKALNRAQSPTGISCSSSS